MVECAIYPSLTKTNLLKRSILYGEVLKEAILILQPGEFRTGYALRSESQQVNIYLELAEEISI